MTMNHPNYADLPVRPAMLQDEWIESYLVRLARAMGHANPSERDINGLRGNCVSTGEERGGLSQGYLPATPAWAKKKLGALIRYCPACLAEERYVRSQWRLTSFEVCTVHELNLKCGCVEPSLMQIANHPTIMPLTELTMEQIWDGASCPMPDSRLHVQRIWSEFEGALAIKHKSTSVLRLAWALLAEQLLDAAVIAELGGSVRVRRELKLDHRVRWLRENKVDIHASQDGILRFLLAIPAHNQRRGVVKCLRKIMTQSALDGDLFAQLPLQYLLDRSIASAPEAACRLSRGVLPVKLHPPGCLSIRGAAGMLGRNTAFVEYMVQQGFFQRTNRIRFGRRLYTFIHETEVEGCRRWLRGCMTDDEVIRHLAMDRAFFRALLRTSLLRPIVLGCRQFFRKDDVATLLSKLDGLAQPHIPDSSLLRPLISACTRRIQRGSPDYDTLLREIWQEKHPIYRKLDEPGLRAYYISLEAIKRAKHLRAEQLQAENERYLIPEQRDEEQQVVQDSQ